MSTPFPFQAKHVSTAVAAPGQRWLFADEMGLGKTLQALLALRALNADRIVVVAPAMARAVWAREAATWWPEVFADPSQIALLDMSPTRKTQTKKRAASWENVLARPLRIVSPELLNAARERAFLAAGARPAIVLDEAHMFAHGTARRSRVLRQLGHRFKGAVFACTATPVPNRPIGMFNLFNFLWPRRFGAPGPAGAPGYGFAFRYVERQYNQYGSVPMGLHPDYADELRARLPWMMSRTTRTEVDHLLPGRQVVPLALLPADKPDDVIRTWCDAARQAASHITILTHRRRRAARLAALLQKAYPATPVVHIDGATPPTQRGDVLTALRAKPQGILVSTMHAVARSIDLSWSGRALLAELYWSPEVLVQVLGRWGRLSSDVSAVVSVMCGGGTVQERIAYSVADKLWDTGLLLKQGATETSLTGALSTSTGDFEAELLNIAESICTDGDLAALANLDAYNE